MSNVQGEGFSGIRYREYRPSSEERVIKTGHVEHVKGEALGRIKHEEQEICLTRQLKDREVVPTGVTKEMVGRFIEGRATDGEKEDVKKMLGTAVGRDLSTFSDESLITISNLLITLDNGIEVIKQILSFLNFEHVLDVLNKQPELLKNEKITVKRLIELSSSNHNNVIRAFVEIVIGEDGRVNVEMMKAIRKFVNIKQPKHSAHVNRIFDLLEKDVKFRELIENIKAPGNLEGSGTMKSYIRTMLRIGEDKEVTKVDAERAVLGAVLSDLRQGKVGSCYGTAIAICVHDSIPHLMVEDLASMVEKGYFTRKGVSGKEERFYIGEGFNFSDWKKFDSMDARSIEEMLNELSIAYPEYREIFLKAKPESRSDDSFLHNFLFDKGTLEILKPIFDDLPKHFEVTEEDLEKEAELKILSKEIRVRSAEASLNNDKEADKKVQELIKKYDRIVNELGEKLFKLEAYNEAKSKLSKMLFAEWNRENLLTKGWEYAILSGELREIERERELRSEKVPVMLQETFKEALFNNDEGAVFIKEMDKVLETMQPLQVKFSQKQQEQLSKFLIEIVKTMKAVVDERITIRTVEWGEIKRLPGTFGTGHYLVYAIGKEVGTFKILDSEAEYSEAILGCMMEAFEKVFKEHGEMEKGIKKFLIKSKGILGDQVQSKEFRNSLNALVVNSTYRRSVDIKYKMRTAGIVPLPIISMYFEQEYSRNLLQIEKPLLLLQKNPIFRKFLEWMGYEKQVGIIDFEKGAESVVNFVNYLDGFREFVDGLGNKPFTTVMALMWILLVTGTSWLVGGVTAGLLAISEILLTRSDDYKTPDADILAHFIEANRTIYKEVKNHDEWVKYPLLVPNHVCNLIPFNKSMREIVESDEDIREYVQKKIASPEITTIAVMDLNSAENGCYAGFELGGGSIRKVILNSEFEYVTNRNVDQYFYYASMNAGIHKVIDEMISNPGSVVKLP